MPDHLYVIALPSRSDEGGNRPMSAYVETFWLPSLGPTATLLYRRLGSAVEDATEPVRFDLAPLAQSLGVGRGVLDGAMRRLVERNVAAWVMPSAGNGSGDLWLGVRPLLARLPYAQVRRLPAYLQAAHEELVSCV